MSDEDYPEPEYRSGFQMDAFIPLVLLSISFIVLLGWQVRNASAQRLQFENAITQAGPAVEKSHQVQAGLAKLANDLMAAAQTDDTAKAIVAKYIQKSGSPDAAASPPPP